MKAKGSSERGVREGSEREGERGRWRQLGCFSGNFNKTFDAAGKLTFSIKCRQRAMATSRGNRSGRGRWRRGSWVSEGGGGRHLTFWPSFMCAQNECSSVDYEE